MLPWDDLRFVLSIARSGNLRTAAAALGVNHSTMFRRLNAAETALGAKLFERLASGYRPTDAGLRLIEAAERIEAETLALDRDLTGQDTRLTGTLRVTASETLAFGMLTAEIARFRERHPGIVVELMVDNRVLDLSRREADIALRATRPAQGDLFGRKLADVRWCFYGAAGANGLPKTRRDLARSPIIRWGEATQPTKAAAWLAKHLADAPVGYRTGSLVNQFMAAKAGLGLALLPCYLGDADAGLVRVLSHLSDLTTELWLVTHRSLKDTARIRAFMEVVGDGLKRRMADISRPRAGAR
jgi:DNA-binding transcriptional LysR family regulator